MWKIMVYYFIMFFQYRSAHITCWPCHWTGTFLHHHGTISTPWRPVQSLLPLLVQTRQTSLMSYLSMCKVFIFWLGGWVAHVYHCSKWGSNQWSLDCQSHAWQTPQNWAIPLHHVSRQIPANFSWCMIWDRDVNMVKFNYPSWILSCLYIGMYFAVDFAVPVSDLGQVRIARRNSGDGSPIYVITHSMY